MATLLITGATGRIGTALRARLLAAGHDLVLLDERPPEPPVGDRERFVPGSVNDRSALETALPGVDTIVHLAGIPTEDEWDALLDANVTGTKNVLEAAAANGVLRVVQASSIHAVGRVPERPDAPGSVPGDRIPRPDSYYGVTKAAMELLGSLFADRFEMSIVSARIGAFGDRPNSARALLMWTSPDDLARLVQATVELTEPGHHVVWAVSRNTGAPADFTAGERIGFRPVDDASAVLDAEERDELPPEDAEFLGGSLARQPLGRARD
ncbi:NAD(P)-dependent dehydrogenase (short-subunit alcohol dehydrogenase family) [Curtobacterium pusillum]|uniref:NAD(P)-dependent dehydrogenase (Short-subunit alcohol dehydrogenase family) n=1 Tax=Curtobacterium pusillum TaxID=69373 RepID=A0AAW3T4D7_9MICO|nr:NAD(P)-dependent oxidoreductase [Curtobacterium pusillum]MBA8989776.1 NAD(P)-dependent dehydrogenase (short-subunit alcohol dehydrogenase family) [Curtobacterium pusillum]